jgi:hypothetical protein
MKKYLTALAAFMLTACLGMKTEIEIKRNGSGTADMTYRISNELFSLGATGGNEGLPPIPVGRDDFERTFNRIQGMEMTSYSEKEDGGDRLILVKSKFDSLDALVSFLDASGKQATLERKDGKTVLSLKLDIDKTAVDASLAPMLPVIFDNYFFDFAASLPNDCEISYTGADGRTLPAPPFGETEVSARDIAFHAPMAALFTEGPAALVIRW